MAKIINIDGKYYFDACDGTEAKECVVWLEKSKANDAHPDGKPWIKLPKDNCTNRAYFSEDLFKKENINGEIEVPVKTTPPRVLGTSGVRADVIKYLDEKTATEYTNLVDGAVEKYKTAKANSKKKKLEDMNEAELQAYIECLKNGTKYTAGDAPKSFIDMFTDEELERYNEILATAMENKANAPKAKRGPLTDAEKAARKAKRDANELTKAEKLLAALQAASVAPAEVEDDADEVEDDTDEDMSEYVEDEVEDDTDEEVEDDTDEVEDDTDEVEDDTDEVEDDEVEDDE